MALPTHRDDRRQGQSVQSEGRGMRCIYCDEKSEETYCSDYCYNMSEYGNEEGVLDKEAEE
tara:strand:- start:432 stop:614 length:183 start_codon:yes stop_codon:yes gene_type:complete